MRVSILILSVFLLSSCFKTKKSLSGRVLNPVTGEGISDVQVNFSKSGDKIEYNGSYESVTMVSPDQNGYFQIDAKTTKNLIANVVRDTYKYYNLGWLTEDGYRNTIVAKKNTNYDYHLVPYGKLQIHIKNINCFDSNDKLELYYDGAEIASTTYSIGKTVEKIGCVDNPGGPVEITMGNKFYHWVVTKNGITTTYFDTIFVTQEGITYFDVFY